MSWFRKAKNIITVEFVEYGAPKPFAVSEVPIDQLPNSFELETELEIREQRWRVVQATPQNKDEFCQTGVLRIVLNKIQMMDPRELLFTLPSVNNEMAPTENSSLDKLFVIREDDWRQCEFVSKKYISELKDELQSVSEIYENHRIGIGFDNIHVRRLIEQPLIDKSIAIEDLKSILDVTEVFEGFGLDGVGRVIDGFAFQVADGMIFYGQLANNKVTVLCVQSHEDAIQTIRHVARKYEILFVDWCKLEVFE